MGAAVVILILLAIAVTAGVTVKVRRRPRGSPPLHPGPPAAWPVTHAPPPGEPGFTIHHNPDPGFTVVARSGLRRVPPPRNARTAHHPATADGFEVGQITRNLTAICKLTGRPAGDCACDRHLANGSGGKR